MELLCCNYCHHAYREGTVCDHKPKITFNSQEKRAQWEKEQLRASLKGTGIKYWPHESTYYDRPHQRPPSICKNCGKEFLHSHRVYQKFCSRKCAAGNHDTPRHALKALEKACPHCHITFFTNSATKIYCTSHCQSQADQARHKALDAANDAKLKAKGLVD